MAEEVIGFRIDVGTEGGQQSIGALRRELSEAKIAMDNAKAGSKEFADSFQRYAAAKNNIRELNEEIRRLNPQKLSQQFVTVGQAVTSGFAAAQGAAALFGAQSEDAAKALLKVQAAMALAQGWRAIHEGAEALGSLRTMALAAAAGMNTLKIALVTTGIGALVVALGFLVQALTDTEEIVIDTSGALSDHEIEVEKLKIKYSNLKGEISDLDMALQLLALDHGKVVSKINQDAAEKLAVTESWYHRVYNAVKSIITRRNEQGIEELTIQKDANKLLAEEQESYELNVANITAEFEARKKKEKEKNNAEEKAALKTHNEDLAKENLAWWDFYLAQLRAKNVQSATDLDALQKETQGVQVKSLTNTVQKKLDIYKFDASQRLLIEQQVFGTLTSLGTIFSKNAAKQAEFQKRIAAVNIIVQQAEALAKAVKQAADAGPFPANLVAIATSVASIVAIFAQIKTVFGKAGDIGGAPSLDTGGVSAPSVSAAQSFTPNESTDLTSQGQSTSTTPQQQTVRAWVVESDITMTQDRVNKLQTWAKFG